MPAETHTDPPELLRVAERVFWWKPPEVALRDRTRFAAQVMTFGTWTDAQTARRLLGDGCFRSALQRPPPGVFDARSWHYWHHVFGLVPVPELPTRDSLAP